MSDLQERLQQALGDAYRIEKELGGGGMSRVFLAEEVRLGRRVVVKMLPPEMGAGVNVERFEREIRLAARLQHPHVVPLLTAGAQGDLLWYIMPYIEGESLRAKLAREGELPVGETLRVLREVLDALAYAHDNGVVHRDIKPDNVLLTGRHAVVTDFGVAKAVSASTDESSLTSLGVALGTPTYMSPEQAAANPHVDHRADLYAVGVLAYEMLTGRPPFAGNVQSVLSAHVTQAPEPPVTYRETIPDALNQLILRCLAKHPADRWQRAEEVLPHIEAMLTPSGGVTPTATQPVPAVEARRVAEQAHPIRLALLFGVAAAVVLALVYGIVVLVGLPDWVFLGAVILLAIGLPIMLLTGHHERQRAMASTGGARFEPPSGVRRLFTWQKALLGGALAFAGLGVVAAGYMAMRAFGIGPVGTLMATGALGERDPVVLAEFDNRTADSTLGPTVTELFRVGMSQSPVITILDQSRTGGILARMQRPPDARIDRDIALEIAEREGLKAVIVGDLVSVGEGFAVSARVLSARGEVLTAQHAAAADAGELITAVEELSLKLRERIGESLRSIRANAPLERMTTSSLEALQLYTQALNAENAGDETRAMALLEEAIAIDTAFAMAYRKLGILMRNNFEQAARVAEVLTKAYELRHRLTDRERAYAVAQYAIDVTGDLEAAIGAYRTLLDRYPRDQVALNNTGVMYFQLRDYPRALEFYERALATDSTGWIGGWGNVAGTQRTVGDVEGSRRTIEIAATLFPDNPRITDFWVGYEYFTGNYAGAAARLRELLARQHASAFWRADANTRLAYVATVQGKLNEASGHWDEALSATAERGLDGDYLNAAIERAMSDLLLTGDVRGPKAYLARELAQRPPDALALRDRPYGFLALFYAYAGGAEEGRRWLQAMERSGQTTAGRREREMYHLARGAIAQAEGDYATAIAALREFDRLTPCLPCGLSSLARAFDEASLPDSAYVKWKSYADTTTRWPIIDATELPTAYRRVGELAEARGDRATAIEYYSKFVDLWRDADPRLQPQVAEVRRRIAQLVGEP